MALLNCACYNLRIACAKTIAVIYGCGHTEAKAYVETNLLKIIDDISMIRKDSYPYNNNDKMKNIILFNLKVITDVFMTIKDKLTFPKKFRMEQFLKEKLELARTFY